MKMIRVHKVNILRLFSAVSFFGHQTLIPKAGQNILHARFVDLRLLSSVEPMKDGEYNRTKFFA